MKKKYTLREVNKLLAVSGLILVIVFGVALYGTSKVHKWCQEYITHLAEGYGNEQNNRLEQIQNQMLKTLMSTKMDYIRLAKDELETYNYYYDLGSEYSTMRENGLQNFNFFLYFQKNKEMVELGMPVNLSKEQIFGMRRTIKELGESGELYEKAPRKWTEITINNKQYMILCYRYMDRIIGVYVPVNHFLSINQVASLTKKDFVLLVEHGEPLTAVNKYVKKNIEHNSFLGLYSRYITADMPINNSEVSIRVVAYAYGVLGEITNIQVLFLGISAGFILISVGILMYIVQRVLIPVYNFSRELEGIGEPARKMADNSFHELSNAAEIYNRLNQQLESIKIDLYEEKLEKQKASLEFLQLQIKPHFFINCLNTIYYMVESEHYDRIKQMTVYVSDYLRYKFKDGIRLVKLSEELKNVENYLHIYELWYGDIFCYKLQNTLKEQEVEFLPMGIQILIENTIKYAVGFGDKVLIYLKTEQEESQLHVTYYDSGPGYPAEYLKAEINNTRGSDNHIGLVNLEQRIKILYGDRGKIELSNQEEAGARADIWIPFHPM
ncbi:Histidine kinase [Anaerocolumna jejuensis DSM 15929]|uniref:Histidine kinase n=1 Tax=Anaerocolumna jejuensis DSM 15929 TaxID=1121322 RepID=A0A1M6Z7J5_9FIRM|nr:histidine kinase [Anaerocolumna jejuensis]SHL26421.1 Histidine kinase [Anaerocolumna jejuensis DSM 15929]